MLQFVIVFGCTQLLMVTKAHTEIINPELDLHEEHIQHNANVNIVPRSSSKDVNLPYDITLEKQKQENGDLSHNNEKYTIRQKGVIVDVIEGYYIDDIYDGDMDKDGVRDLIFKTYDGGAHCCFDLYIMQVTEEMKKPMKLPLKNLDAIQYKDLDGDGIQEWIMYDDRYSYFLTCFACSPVVQVVATYKKGKLILRPKLTKKYTVPKLKKLTPSHVFLNSYGDFYASQEEHFSAIVESLLFHFYSGDTNEALYIIDKYLIFEGRGVKLLFLKALIERMSESYFWDQLRKINHFNDTEDIAISMFKRLEGMKHMYY